MLTPHDLLCALLAPVLVAAAIAGVGRWRHWAWAMPAAAGAGFVVCYALLGVPRLPPRDGTDWLFWLACPLTLLGILDACFPRRRGWIGGATAGVVAFVLLHPLIPTAVTSPALWGTSLALAVAGAALVLALHWVEPRIGPAAVVAGLCIATGGAAVTVLSSNLRIVGIYGLAAAAALGPVAVFAATFPAAIAIRPPRVTRSTALVAVPLLAGLLVAGRFYPEPGVPWPSFVLLMASPVLLLLGAAVPAKRIWVRGVVAVVVLAVAIAVVVAPAALKAKKAAEGESADPYEAYP